MKYFEQVKKDIENWINDNGDYYFNIEDYRGDRDGFEEFLNDELWTADDVTGNASGSYTFNREEAKQYVLEDMDTVAEALQEFCTSAEEIAKHFISEDWEWFDVTARCFVLGSAIYEVCEDLDQQGAFDEIEDENEPA